MDAPLDIETLRHPSEPSRFALAVLACSTAVGALSFVVLSVAGPVLLVVYLLAVGAFLGWIWLALQLWRMRLLGAAVRVSPDTFPHVQDAVDEVRERLSYDARLDIFIVPKQNPSITLTSYFGTRVLIVEGGAIADLTKPEKRPQLLYILATHVGALTARHARWTPAFIAFEALGLTGVLLPFLMPWFRATIYTGDQIAYASVADLDVSIEAVHRVLVGKDIVPQLHADGLIQQSSTVRRSKILRLSQLFMPEPHATNRYLNLLAFAQRRDHERVEQYRWALAEWANVSLEEILPYFHRRRSSGASAHIGLAVAGCVLVAAVVSGWVVYNAGQATVDASAPTEPPSEVLRPPPARDPTVELLLARVPDFMEPCSETLASDEATIGLVAAVTCVPGGVGTPVSVSYYAYQDLVSVNYTFDAWVAGLPNGSCTSGNTQDTWIADGVTMGRLACYETTAGDNLILWTYDSEGILVFARSFSMNFFELYALWQEWADLKAPPPVYS